MRDRPASGGASAELSRMASREGDELANMAGGESSLAREIEQELAGAHVTFEGDRPTIAPDAAASSESAPPRAQAQPVAGARPVPSTPVQPKPVAPPRRDPAARGAASRSERNPPIAWVDTDREGRVIGPPAGAAPPSTNARKALPLGPLAIIACVVLATISRTGSGSAAFVAIVSVALVAWLLFRFAGQTGRKTTTMPWDANAKRRRR